MSSIDVNIKKALQKAIMKEFEIDLNWENIVIEKPKNKNQGDLSSNCAMQLTRQLKRNPREVAISIVNVLDLTDLSVEKVEIAGPGFINFTLEKDSFSKVITEVLEKN